MRVRKEGLAFRHGGGLRLAGGCKTYKTTLFFNAVMDNPSLATLASVLCAVEDFFFFSSSFFPPFLWDISFEVTIFEDNKYGRLP